MLVSAVIATYNAAEYLKEALESVLAQTYRPIEIVVVDDGSTDHTREVCASFGSAVKYFYQPQDGTLGATAHLRTIRESTGELIAYLDHDDRWLPTKIEKQVKALEANPEAGAAFTGYQWIDNKGTVVSPEFPGGPSGYVFHELLQDCPYCASSAMVRRSALMEVGLHSKDIITGDWDRWIRLTRLYPVVVIDECLTQYRVFESNFSRNKERIIKGVNQIIDLNRERLHPDCAECEKALQKGIKRMFRMDARRNLDYYHEAVLKGDLSGASPFLWQALRSSPPEVLRPRRLMAVIKNALLAPIRKVREEGVK